MFVTLLQLKGGQYNCFKGLMQVTVTSAKISSRNPSVLTRIGVELQERILLLERLLVGGLRLLVVVGVNVSVEYLSRLCAAINGAN